jgi:transcriptional regulator with XRE-family HTH domain
VLTSEEIAQRFSDCIKHRREEKRLTQLELAKIAGCNASTVNQIEKHKQNPSANTMARLAAALDVNLGLLLEGQADTKIIDDPVMQCSAMNVYQNAQSRKPLKKWIADWKLNLDTRYAMPGRFIWIHTGDSMSPHIEDGEHLLMRPFDNISIDTAHGEICLVDVGKEVLLRLVHVVKQDDVSQVRLVPLNPSFQVKTYRVDEGRVNIVGSTVHSLNHKIVTSKLNLL